MALMQIGDGDLQAWSEIGEGAFGQVYKAINKDLEMDVAIKILHHDEGLMLQKEAEKMRAGGFQYVVSVLGMYRGFPPDRRGPPQHGLVMEFVERGSIGSLLRRLGGPPPWPLAFRLCHQVALGMNYLHRLSPALLHLDLKPSNVLLDDGLSVKLTDFGLSRSVLTVSTVMKRKAGGTLGYMPPEAFSLSYKPSPASDSYSYAILLWSVLTGQEPYSGALPCTIRFKVPKGDRPRLDLLDGVEDLGEITGLMVKLWDHSPENRPAFRDCLPVTKKVFKLHESGIHDAIHQVMSFLDSKGPANLEQEESASSTQPNGGTGVAAPTGLDNFILGALNNLSADLMHRFKHTLSALHEIGYGLIEKESNMAITGRIINKFTKKHAGGRASDSSFTPTEGGTGVAAPTGLKKFIIDALDNFSADLMDKIKHNLSALYEIGYGLIEKNPIMASNVRIISKFMKEFTIACTAEVLRAMDQHHQAGGLEDANARGAGSQRKFCGRKWK